jgi:uncharacterized protein YdaU (DUF1376 family)
MKKPDRYMPMFWPDFWQAVEGLDCKVIVAYQRCLTFYWFHTGCTGLPDDDERLRGICRLDNDEWTDWKKILFSKDNDGFWFIKGGKWHNKRAIEVWNISLVHMNMMHDRAINGANARWKNK